MVKFRITTNGIRFRIEYGQPQTSLFRAVKEFKWYPVDQVECYQGKISAYHKSFEEAQQALDKLVEHHASLWTYTVIPGSEREVE